MVKLHGLKNCDTCRKALKWMKENQVSGELIDVRQSPLARDELVRFVVEIGIDKLINKRGTTWRQLPGDEAASLSVETAPDLLTNYPAIMKRPVVDTGKTLLIGFDAAVQQELLQYSNS